MIESNDSDQMVGKKYLCLLYSTHSTFRNHNEVHEVHIPGDERWEVISIDVAQVRSAADEADYRADHYHDQGAQKRVVHEGYPVYEKRLVHGFDLNRILRHCARMIEQTRHVQATLRRRGQRFVIETTIRHMPLRADDDPDHGHHRDQSADHRPLGRRPGYQHP